MNFAEMFPSFKNYTEEMYEGNCPTRTNEVGYEIWHTKYGETVVGKYGIINSQFSLGNNVTIYIMGNSLWVTKIKQSGFYQFKLNFEGIPKGKCVPEHRIFELEKEDVLKLLNKNIPNCKLWNMVRDRILDLITKEEENE